MTKKVLDSYLESYCSNKKLRERWGTLITQRALRFYLESNFDSSVAQEDLLDCNFEDCDCSGDKHRLRCKFWGEKPNYCNLEYSEKIERRFQ